MDPSKTALLLIGYQNDYFAADGVLRSVIEATSRITGALANTIDLIERLEDTPLLMISTPINFMSDYAELVEPVGILKAVKEAGAFRSGTPGADTVPELKRFGDRIVEVPGKRGLNAFSNTELEDLLAERGVDTVVIAGVVTSICIDSTARSAHDRGLQVTVLSDCTSGRTMTEQQFYCESIFPLYADVTDHNSLLEKLAVPTV